MGSKLNGRTSYSKSLENLFDNLSTLYLNDFLINFLMILSEATLALLVEHGLIISRKSISKIYQLSI